MLKRVFGISGHGNFWSGTVNLWAACPAGTQKKIAKKRADHHHHLSPPHHRIIDRARFNQSSLDHQPFYLSSCIYPNVCFLYINQFYTNICEFDTAYQNNQNKYNTKSDYLFNPESYDSSPSILLMQPSIYNIMLLATQLTEK